jgi:murein L,D-transpeptidase YcbB/YkuD
MLKRMLSVLMILCSSTAFAATGSLAEQNLLAATSGTKAQREAIEYSIASMRKINLSKRYIIVNVPAYKLYAVENGNVVLESKVVVGTGSTEANKTPELSSRISGVMYNPYWSPPPGLLEDRILPKWERDPAYLRKAGYTVMRVFDQVYVDETQVTPDMILSKKYAIMQKPGPNNVLGKILFILEDSQDVYLHDTNHRELFNLENRNSSFGCIRVQNWQELASWILQVPSSYIARSVQTDFTSTDSVAYNLPIHLVYWPADVVNGKVVFYPDVYNKINRN